MHLGSIAIEMEIFLHLYKEWELFYQASSDFFLCFLGLEGIST